MSNSDIKRIRLVHGTAYPAHMIVEVFDFPKGEEARDEQGEKVVRKRCEIDVEYSEDDIRPLIAAGKDEAGILQHYRDWMYELIKTLISSDWEAESGLEEVMEIVREKAREAKN